MPIYEYYCPDNHRIYQFYAKTLAQGRRTPQCPDNPGFRMVKLLSGFSVTGSRKEPAPDAGAGPPAEGGDDSQMDAAMSAMEREFEGVDENDPRAMGRMMRRMSELTGEPLGGEMEEVVRKLEEGADPESLEDQLGGGEGEGGEEGFGGGPDPGPAAASAAERTARRAPVRRGPAVRDPKLYDYE